jgi:putative spermidine/putrescine transport system ATP-binding protein
MALADRLVLLHDGKVQQIGPPETLHLRPSNPFVARFIGGSNIVQGRIDTGTQLNLPDGPSIQLATAYPVAGVATLAVRPDSIRLSPPGGTSQVEGTIELCSWLGATVEHVVRLSPEVTMLVRGPGLGPDAMSRQPAGTRVELHWSSEDEFLFDASDRPLQAAKAQYNPTRETNHA